jgi:hypothetical protein
MTRESNTDLEELTSANFCEHGNELLSAIKG